ncbi:WhiB family transcriptional regulator [Streptomyces boncukensis]|uniref:WhiB family transcriptional regulator n=1 Tax=Streptomyces boncukensis TaxID=2711219 RepID=UPI0019CFFD88
MTWHHAAACRDHDPEIWFPSDGDAADRARAICAACPVKAPCLQLALLVEGNTARDSRYGIFAGLTGRQRRYAYEQLRESGHFATPHNWRTAPCGTRAAYRRHQRHGETPCAACRRAETAGRAAS